MKERVGYIDAVAGLMILWMCLGHLKSVADAHITCPNILFFFMPWFFFKAGYLWRTKNAREVLIGGGKKLLRPYLYSAIFGQIVLTICMLVEGVGDIKPYIYSPIRHILVEGNTNGNPPLWFLPVLVLVQLLGAWIRGKRYIQIICAIIGIIVAWGLSSIQISWFPMWIPNTLAGFFFFSCGCWLQKYASNKKVIIGAMIVLLIGVSTCFSCVGMRGNSLICGNYFVWALTSVAGCIIVNECFRQLSRIYSFPCLRIIGRNALQIYVMHWVVYLLVVRLIMDDLLHITNEYLLFCAGGIISGLIITCCIGASHQYAKRGNIGSMV